MIIWLRASANLLLSPLGSGGHDRCFESKIAIPSPDPRLRRGSTSPEGRDKKRASSILAPDAERFLGRAVRDAEQHGFASRAVRVTLPRRNDEDISGRPFQRLVIKLGCAFAFDADEDRAVGRTIRLARKALGQQCE